MMRGLLQFTLDLFEPAAGSINTLEKTVKNTEKSDLQGLNQPLDQEIRGQAATDSIAIDSSLPTQTL